MKQLTPIREIEEAYLRKHPEEIDEYITILFEDYQKDGDLKALLASLRVIGRVKGIGNIAAETGLSRFGIHKVLSEEGNPTFANLNAIMQAMGYRLRVTPEKIFQV